MNKTTEALKLALNLLESEWPEGDEIAQPVIDAVREALADHIEQNLTMVADHSGDVNEMVAEPKCSDHPDAPHGFDRNASHNANRYVCECEGWEPPVQEPVAVVEITYGREPECYVTGNIDNFPEGVFKLYAAPVQTVKQEPVACPNLEPVIHWLENGCDPKEAAKELRIYQDQMKAAPVDAKAIRAEALVEPDIEEMTLTQIASRHEPVKQEPVGCCENCGMKYCECGERT